MEHYKLNYNTRVGVEFGMESIDEEFIVVRLHPDNDWQIELSTWVARDLIKRLKKAANLLDPPKSKRRG